MLYRDILIIRRSKSVKHIASRHKDLKRFLMIYSAVERVSKIEPVFLSTYLHVYHPVSMAVKGGPFRCTYIVFV